MQKNIILTAILSLLSLSVAFSQAIIPFTYEVGISSLGEKQIQFSSNAPDEAHSFKWVFNHGEYTSHNANPEVLKDLLSTKQLDIELSYILNGEQVQINNRIDPENISKTLLHPDKTEVIEVRSDKIEFPTIPNVFTPNGDSVNDYFELKIPEPNTIILKVFSRIGMLVYEKEASYIHWDGKNYYGQDLPDGIYYYVITDTENIYNPATGFLYIYR